jgi:hypothetical protein
LASRAERTVLGVNEPKLRAFCLRLMDDNLPETDWLESIGSFLALKPPSKWYDSEADMFEQELSQLAMRFLHVEGIVFSTKEAAQGNIGVRLAITQANGDEYERVVYCNPEEECRLRELQTQIEAIFLKDKRLALAAVSRVICLNLKEKGV